ncbi:MAG: helix-turn-helix domain-containing protein [Candidatus Yanofskybacteria bacterium]|nr:helix-turn-helix domain-containing protein [Candidatus Yanofskybacteria bacterium]
MKKAKKTKQFLTVKDVAKRLSLTEKSIFRFIKSGELAATKLGRWRIMEKDLNGFIKRRSNIKRKKTI